MSRKTSGPSYKQVEMLIENLEKKRWLATGHARTSHARNRTKVSWEGLAIMLNSNGTGCIKTWQQWSKDKKAAVKRKASQIRIARQRTGGGGIELEETLSTIDERIISLIGGEDFFSSDRELEIQVIHQSDNEPGPSNVTTGMPALESNINILNMPGDIEEENETPGSESILKHWNMDNISMENHPNSGDMFASGPSPAVSHRRNIHVGSASPCRRRLVRRRIIQRSPPAQRRSQMASLTERLVAIEEQRLINGQLLMRNVQKIVNMFKSITESRSPQIKALQDY